MNPLAPVSMLSGKGSMSAIFIVAGLMGLILVAKQNETSTNKK